ncbi:MAG: M64 family metallopeptidase [Planctomycetota bacterium]
MTARFLVLTALTVAAAAPAQTVTTVLANGTTQTRYDMVILGDGYQAGQQALFNANVMTFLTALFQKQPYQTFAAYYNVHTVFRASVDAGADRPDENPPIYRNTVYDSTYNYGGVDRCLYVQNTSAALADAALAPANEGRVMVLVNDNRYGGCAGTFAVSYNGSSMNEVQIHELGHSLGQLADEYDYPNQTYTGGEPSAVNITTSPTGQKWSIWWGTDGISSFQGAGYYLYGLYRPKSNCLMRALGAPLCRVCQENVAKVTNSIVDTIVTTSPAATAVTVAVPTPQQFVITHIVPAANQPLIAWKLDGAVIPGATGTSYTLTPTMAMLGNHTLEVSVHDQTQLVRSDPQQVMRETHSWQVTIADPTAAQLRIPAANINPIFVQGGTTVTLTATVANDGPAAAGAFAVEFFVSPTTTWNPNGIYLGATTVPGLNAAQTTTVQYTTTLPWTLPVAIQYGHAVADRLDVVHETNENDNLRNFVLIGQTGPCVTKLEYRSPLVQPAGPATLSLATGGTLRPAVFAPCVNPAATIYLLAWTGSGTAPGIQLAPGVLLPLNFDALTQLGLDGLNGPVFGSFLGVFDAQGIGQATFTLPPALPLAPGQTSFAAVLLSSTQLFAATTNAISLVLVP